MPTKAELAAFRERFLEAIRRLEARKKDRFSQTELAKRWKVSQGSVSSWMAGKGIPDRDQIRRIAADCGVDPGWLDWGTGPANPSTPVDDDGTEAGAKEL